MPTPYHDALAELVAKSPDAAMAYLRRLTELPVSGPVIVQARPADIRDVPNVELRADALLDATGEGERCLVVVEVQRAVDAEKGWRWPRYVMVLRDDHRCEVRLVVLATRENVAAWARRPIVVGPGMTFTPLVIGPSDVPRLDNLPPGERTALAVLFSAAFHVTTMEELETFNEVVEADWPPEGLSDIGGRVGYFEKLAVLVGWELISLMEAKMELTGSDRAKNPILRALDSGRVEGRVEGRVDAFRDVLLARLQREGARVSPALRERVEGCMDPSLLTRWVERLMTGATLEEALAG